MARKEQESSLFRHEREKLKLKKRKKLPFDQNVCIAKVPDNGKARKQMF